MRQLLAAIVCLYLIACGGDLGAPTATAAPDDSSAKTIADVQGDGEASPFEGEQVTISGVVTGDFQNKDPDAGSNLGGFFVQAESPDSNPSTSDGIFIFDGEQPLFNVNVGDKVSVTGVVKEYFGETQIAASSVTIDGAAVVQAAFLKLPAASVANNSDKQVIANLESYEGMLVRIEQTLTVGQLYGLERFGELTLTEGGRLYQFTNRNAPETAGYAAHREKNARRTIVLDDGRRGQNETPIRYLHSSASAAEVLRAGSTVAGLTGVLRFSRASGSSGKETWRLLATVEPVFVADNPRPGAPDIAGELRIASFNALNFFSTINSGKDNCGPTASSGCRGADSEAELERQLAKTTTALAMIDADVVGLIEIENNGSASLQLIVDALNATMGAGTYSYVNTGPTGGGAIKMGFIFKPASVTPSGSHAIITAATDVRFKDGRNRPTFAQTFVQNSDNQKLTIVVNHLKSKGSACDHDGDPNIADGQSNCNLTRTAAAIAIAEWLQSDPTASNDPDFLIIGDLNAHLREDPLTAFSNAGFFNLLGQEHNSNAYSFVFDAQVGALDHALVSASLAPQVVETMEWHINADEAPVHDYNLERNRDPTIFDGTTPYRASDHDPVIVGLDLHN